MHDHVLHMIIFSGKEAFSSMHTCIFVCIFHMWLKEEPQVAIIVLRRTSLLILGVTLSGPHLHEIYRILCVVHNHRASVPGCDLLPLLLLLL